LKKQQSALPIHGSKDVLVNGFDVKQIIYEYIDNLNDELLDINQKVPKSFKVLE
jgi:hypothetical protein